MTHRQTATSPDVKCLNTMINSPQTNFIAELLPSLQPLIFSNPLWYFGCSDFISCFLLWFSFLFVQLWATLGLSSSAGFTLQQPSLSSQINPFYCCSSWHPHRSPPPPYSACVWVTRSLMSFMFFCFFKALCVFVLFCMRVGEEMKVGDIPKPSLPSILPKKPLPPKTSSSSSSLPPRRPERPPTLASVHAHTPTYALMKENPITSPSSRGLMVLYGLPAQVWKPQVWGRGFDTRFCPWQVTWHRWVFDWPEHRPVSSSVTVRAPSLCPRVKRHLFLCVFADVDLDAVVSSAEKLSHPTASRPRVTDRRPRSQIITSVRLVGNSCVMK